MKTLLETLTDYQAWMESKKWRPRAIDAYVRELRRFGRWLPVELDKLSQDHVELYQIERRHLSASSLRKTISAVKSWGRWAVKTGLIAANPAEDMEYPRKTAPVPRDLSSDELAIIEQWLDDREPTGNRELVQQRDRLAIILMLYAGLRLSECCDLRWTDIDLGRNMLRVVDGKGGKTRMVPIHARLKAELQEQPKPRSGPVLRNSSKLGGIVSKTLRQTFWRRLARLGLDVSAHQLRHTFATTLLNNGADLMTICELLGHESLDTTRIYLRLETRRKIEAINHLPDRLS